MLKFFIDFDGTITKQDVGDALFETFGGEQCKEFVREYHEEKISAVECFQKETAVCGIVEKNQLDGFLDAQEIDETFPEFVAYCTSNGFEHYILSDGMDYYIQRILNRYGVGDVPVYANILHLEPVNGNSSVKFRSEFPFTDEVCTRCASCKRNHILTLSGDDDIIAYIGEGYSDRCPVRYADVVFAKDDLLKLCRREEIPHVEYQTFADIVKYVDKMIHKNGRTKIKLKKRRLAELARREVFAGG
ncbi:MAG: MtnX-like HAD-IB family phosphatase [Ignavibacteriales bacterium]|nr:MtnX-like HAD-IB family phosphatase [Ignavibacteriales bacterium]